MALRKSFAEWCRENNQTELLTEWHSAKNGELTPESVSYGSEKKIWWKCHKGHEWVAQLNSRTNMVAGCPICSGHRVLEGYNDLATIHPEIAAEWNLKKKRRIKPKRCYLGIGKKSMVEMLLWS